jgi:hypothetical protein
LREKKLEWRIPSSIWEQLRDRVFSTKGPSVSQGAVCLHIEKGGCRLLVDAKALYNAAQKEHVRNFEDHRTGIEVMVMKQRMKAAAVNWLWVSSERQYADGLTKIAALLRLLEVLDRLGLLGLLGPMPTLCDQPYMGWDLYWKCVCCVCGYVHWKS